MEGKLLTIGIPTYNRVEALNKALKHLLPQLKGFEEDIEVIISDNASECDNKSVVDSYVKQGNDIRYIKQDSNLGMDGNFTFLYKIAAGKYVWLLSDDDIVVENGFNRILDILKGEEVGSIYLNNKWFGSEIDLSVFDTNEPTRKVVYYDPKQYFERVNYWVTFLSANIVNKSLLQGKINLTIHQNTYLALLSWIIPAIFQDKPNVFIENYILACNGKGQGGYKFIEVFAYNFNKILNYFIDNGYPSYIKKIINDALLRFYFPPFISAKKNNQLLESSYQKESWFGSLYKVYFNNINFYKSVLPVFLFSTQNYNRWRRLTSFFSQSA